MKPTRFEEGLIHFLSKVAQLSNNYLGFGLIATALLVNIMSTTATMLLILAAIYFIFGIVKIEIQFYFAVLGMILSNAVLFICCVGLRSTIDFFLCGRLVTILNLQESPNKNKYTSWLMFCRASVPGLFFMYLLFGYVDIALHVVLFLFSLSIALSMYLLCADKPKPNKEKKRIQYNRFTLEGSG